MRDRTWRAFDEYGNNKLAIYAVGTLVDDFKVLLDTAGIECSDILDC
ncbi:hypothetical protein [Bradyrhizobium vignae]|nr:hypothetical protein [Bradyrhizobium vignae]